MSTTLTEVAQSVADLHAAVNVGFLLISGVLVFFMQCGFATLVAGSIRAKNVKHVMLLHALDCCVCAIWFYLLGFANEFGTYEDGTSTPFVGTGFWALSRLPTNYTGGASPDAFGTQVGTYTYFYFQYAFASAAATIVIGAVAERSTVTSYFCYSSLISVFVYPVIAHWVWSASGWLSVFNGNSASLPLLGTGMVDFAGSGVVHMTGGVAGGWGAYMLGPRLGRFGVDGKPREIASHSAALITIGTFLLWLGWYGFNPGSALSLTGSYVAIGRIAVVQTLSAGAAGLTGLFLRFSIAGHFPLETTMNSILAGLVGVTGPCAYIEPWAGIICGVTSACVYLAASSLWIKLRIDDPVDACPLHGFVGAWGLIFGSLLAKREFLQEFVTNQHPDANGLFYGGSDCWRYLVCAIVGVVVIVGWVSAFVVPLFFVLHFFGVLRVPPEMEMAGLDVTKHGGAGYAGDNADEVSAASEHEAMKHHNGEVSPFRASRSFNQRRDGSSSSSSASSHPAGGAENDAASGGGGIRQRKSGGGADAEESGAYEIFSDPIMTAASASGSGNSGVGFGADEHDDLTHDVERDGAVRR